MHRRLPVTLVGGLLGAGKTSLLHHLITGFQDGNLAVLIDSPGALNPDAKALRGLCGAMRRRYDTVVEIPAGDEDAQLDAIALRLREFAESGRYRRVMIEVGGVTNAARWGSQFSMPAGGRAPFDSWAELEQIVCVVDALDCHRTFASSESSSESHPLRDLQRVQVEGAGLVVLNKCDMVGESERRQCTHWLRSINPDARIVETAYGEAPPEMIFTPRQAKPLVLEAGQNSPASESTDAFESVAFRAHRPFHPARFWDWFNAEHAGLLRVKGLVWLATRNLLVGGISRTVLQNSCGAAGIWWAALPREEWPGDPDVLAQMQAVWHEPYGDRRQELVLIGEKGPTTTAARRLNQCLLTDEEYGRPLAEWLRLPDPFPAWDLEA